MPGVPFADPFSRRLLDVAVVLWLTLWIVLGVAVKTQVQHLNQLNDTVSTAGSAFLETGRTLEELGSVPFVGDQIAQAGRRLEETGRNAIAGARTSRQSVRSIGLILGFTIATAPTVPVFVMYVPWRVWWGRRGRRP